jgi:hypothetical protein
LEWELALTRRGHVTGMGGVATEAGLSQNEGAVSVSSLSQNERNMLSTAQVGHRSLKCGVTDDVVLAGAKIGKWESRHRTGAAALVSPSAQAVYICQHWTEIPSKKPSFLTWLRDGLGRTPTGLSPGRTADRPAVG